MGILQDKPRAPDQEKRMLAALPQEMHTNFMKVVLAGKKILIDPSMDSVIKDELSQDKPNWQKFGEGIAGLMAMLDHQSGNKLPQNIIIPAAICLTFEAADYLSGVVKLSDDELAQAAMHVTFLLLHKMRVPGAQIAQMIQKVASQSGTKPAAEIQAEVKAEVKGA